VSFETPLRLVTAYLGPCIGILKGRMCLSNKSNLGGELMIDQLVGFLVVEPTYPGLSPRLGTGVHIFLDLFQDLLALYFQW
jgi:hypothetical protein